MTGVLAISDQERRLLDALGRLRAEGFTRFEAFSPLPSGELLEACAAARGAESGASPDASSCVRYYTLAGAITGLIGALALTYGASLSWPLITGGKPIVTFMPFSVIVFETTILLAGLFTVAGFFIHGGLFRGAVPGTISRAHYSERFSVDTFGLFVACKPQQVEAATRAMRASGLEEISVETA